MQESSSSENSRQHIAGLGLNPKVGWEGLSGAELRSAGDVAFGTNVGIVCYGDQALSSLPISLISTHGERLPNFTEIGIKARKDISEQMRLHKLVREAL